MQLELKHFRIQFESFSKVAFRKAKAANLKTEREKLIHPDSRKLQEEPVS